MNQSVNSWDFCPVKVYQVDEYHWVAVLEDDKEHKHQDVTVYCNSLAQAVRAAQLLSKEEK